MQLFEPRHRRFLNMNKSLGEGLAALLSSQLVIARYQEQKSLLVMSELKLARAQVNPHFLFNALNTIIAILRSDSDRARDLLIHLSNFFRKNLKRASDVSTLAEELEHVSAYLEIEKARFEGRIAVETEVDPELLSLRLPAFTLQPLVENAFKHGFSATLGAGRATIRAYRRDGAAVVEIEDNAGAWTAPRESAGLGMQIVDKRVKNLYGEGWGVSVECVPQEVTRVTIRLPGRSDRVIRALIVDDEPHAREELESLLGETGEFESWGAAPTPWRRCRPSAASARRPLPRHPDAGHLRIRAPGDDRRRGACPEIVFVTAHDEYALRAFEENALDYLLKPVEQDRLAKTVERLRRARGVPRGRRAPAPADPADPLPAGRAIKLVDLAEVELAALERGRRLRRDGEGGATSPSSRCGSSRNARACPLPQAGPRELDQVDEIPARGRAAEIRTRSGKNVPVSRRFLAKLRERLEFSRFPPRGLRPVSMPPPPVASPLRPVAHPVSGSPRAPCTVRVAGVARPAT